MCSTEQEENKWASLTRCIPNKVQCVSNYTRTNCCSRMDTLIGSNRQRLRHTTHNKAPRGPGPGARVSLVTFL